MKIKEIFHTIQGEGPHAGIRATFIRVSDCPLSCYWCDTDFEGGTHLRVEEIVAATRYHLVVITGGEPMASPALRPLCQALLQAGKLVQVETSGIKHVDLPLTVEVVVSPKTSKIKYHGHVTAFKYILRANHVSPRDGLPTESTQTPGIELVVHRPEKEKTFYNGTPVYVQPCDEGDLERNRANLAACIQSVMWYGYRLSVQLHKLGNIP